MNTRPYPYFQMCLRSLLMAWLAGFYADAPVGAAVWGLLLVLDCGIWAWDWADK